MCLNWSITTAQSCDPSVLNYDAIVSSFHATIIHQPDGTFKVFGEQMKPDGVAAQLSPTLINSTNYAGLTGTPLFGSVAVTGSAILLTTTGLWAWGSERILSSANTTGANFQKVPINGKADGLPTGITPTDVKMMFVSDELIAITTNAGNVYVISSTSVDVRGAGTAATSNTQWYQVTTSASGNPVLSNISVARGNANGSMMALANDGKVYTWGDDTYLGNGSALATRNRATLMTLPVAFTTTNIPKEIGMTTSGLGFSSYYVLDKSGTLYSLGDNSDSQLGDFTTTTRTSWVNVKKTVSTNFTDCVYFSPNEHYLGNGSVNAIDATGQLYNWGSNAGTMLGRSGGTVDPGVPGGVSTPQISGVLYVETGGHTTVAVTSGSTKYCYVGHRINGSMGDGTATDTNENTFNCATTGPAQVCGATSFDSGDAPVSYEGNGGTDLCQHIFVNTATSLYLGSIAPTANNNNLKNVAAGASNIGTNGDGAEEDGLTTVPVYANSSTYSLSVKVKNTTGAVANLYGWVDWNNNGVFDAAELVSATVASNATTATLNWTGQPTNLIVGTKYYIRLRLATEVLTSPLGAANTGEVEDYFMTATAACNAGTTAPILSATTKGNVCPATTVDLTTITASNTPVGTTLTFHTGTPAIAANQVKAGNPVTDPTAVPAGTYYAAFYDAANNCYSGTAGSATTAVTATSNGCVCPSPIATTAPINASNSSIGSYTTVIGSNSVTYVTGNIVLGTNTNAYSMNVSLNTTVVITAGSHLTLTNLSVSGKLIIQAGASVSVVGLALANGILSVNAGGIIQMCESSGIENCGNTTFTPFPSIEYVGGASGKAVVKANYKVGIFGPIVGTLSMPLIAPGVTTSSNITIATPPTSLNLLVIGSVGTASTCTIGSNCTSLPFPVTTTCGEFAIVCNAGTTAPAVSVSTKTNICPATTIDLTSITATNTLVGTTLTFHTGTPATGTNQVKAGNPLTDPTAVPAGTYYAAFYDATNNCYSGTAGSATTAVTATSNPCGLPVAGTIDCSKTQIFTAPVVGVAGQKTLVITINVTSAGCFTPITVSGSGMTLANSITQVCTATTGIQTFSIPVNYDGTTLGTMNFTVGTASNAGNCTADLAKAPKKVISDVWTLDCVPTAAPSLK